MNLKVYILPPLNLENCSISNVNSYQCSCKQCCPIAVYAMFYSLIRDFTQ